MDQKYVCQNYNPLPLSIERGQGIYVWDIEERKYFDFLCGYSSNNMGHSHPRIVDAFITQARKITQTSRAFGNTQMAAFGEHITKLMGYDKVLPMNTGCEACETACKIARRWAYRVKGIENDKANILMANGSFWGRSITASGASDDF
jgi:ornithine--oxo-acid transaminase